MLFTALHGRGDRATTGTPRRLLPPAGVSSAVVGSPPKKGSPPADDVGPGANPLPVHSCPNLPARRVRRYSRVGGRTGRLTGVSPLSDDVGSALGFTRRPGAGRFKTIDPGAGDATGNERGPDATGRVGVEPSAAGRHPSPRAGRFARRPLPAPTPSRPPIHPKAKPPTASSTPTTPPRPKRAPPTTRTLQATPIRPSTRRRWRRCCSAPITR